MINTPSEWTNITDKNRKFPIVDYGNYIDDPYLEDFFDDDLKLKNEKLIKLKETVKQYNDETIHNWIEQIWLITNNIETVKEK